MSYPEYLEVKEVSDIKMVNRLIQEDGWEIIDTRVEEWVETENSQTYKKSCFYVLLGKRL